MCIRDRNITFTYRHQTLVIDPLLDDIRNDVNTNRDAAAAAQTTADGAGSAADAAQSAADAAQAAAEATEDKVDAVRQRAALLQSSDWQGTVNVGNSPFGVAFDGTHIWVTNHGDGTVSKIPVG